MNAKSKASCQASLTSTKCRDVWIECWCWWKNWKNWKSCFEEVCARHMNICTNVAVTKFQKSCQHTVLVQLRASDVNVAIAQCCYPVQSTHWDNTSLGRYWTFLAIFWAVATPVLSHPSRSWIYKQTAYNSRSKPDTPNKSHIFRIIRTWGFTWT